MSAVEALVEATTLRAVVLPDMELNDETRRALLELAQSRADDTWFALARGRLDAAIRTHGIRVRLVLLPHVASAFDLRERRQLGERLARHLGAHS